VRQFWRTVRIDKRSVGGSPIAGCTVHKNRASSRRIFWSLLGSGELTWDELALELSRRDEPMLAAGISRETMEVLGRKGHTVEGAHLMSRQTRRDQVETICRKPERIRSHGAGWTRGQMGKRLDQR
jgi:hypothetical protein